jgi:hypothetical protein
LFPYREFLLENRDLGHEARQVDEPEEHQGHHDTVCCVDRVCLALDVLKREGKVDKGHWLGDQAQQVDAEPTQEAWFLQGNDAESRTEFDATSAKNLGTVLRASFRPDSFLDDFILFHAQYLGASSRAWHFIIDHPSGGSRVWWKESMVEGFGLFWDWHGSVENAQQSQLTLIIES